MELKTSIRRLLRRLPQGSGLFTRGLDNYLDGNKLTLLTSGGEVFREMWRAIEGAKETIHLEVYIFKSDRTGKEFARRLEAKARSGVRVRVIFDAIGSFGLDAVFINRLRNAGVQFVEYHPVAPWRPRWAWNRRDHRKNLIVDSRIAFTGGVNISDDHAPLEDLGLDWRDVHVKLEGPAALELDRVFRQTWFGESKRWFSLDMGAPPPAGSSKVWVVSNQEFLHRYRIRAAYLSALRAAQKQVIIANAYFVPDYRTTRALASAARRGVDVRVMVQGQSDVSSVWHAGRYQFEFLLRRGVRIFEWVGPILHSKTAVVDEKWATVGSYNMDHRSLLMNLEVNLNVLEAEFARKLSRALLDDIALSRELKLDEWRARPYLDKVKERWWHLFRYFF